MDYVEGATLSHVRAGSGEGRWPPDEAMPDRRRRRRAVAHAHRLGVVHRDLKPGNVMVEPGGRVVVMDFGLAKAMGSSGLPPPRGSSSGRRRT